MLSLRVAALAGLLVVTNGFRAPLKAGRGRPLRAAIDVEAEEMEQPQAKKDLLALVDGSGVMSGDAFNRPEVLEVLLRLEPLNPTAESAYSEKLFGDWELKYDAGFQAGLVDSPTRELALFVYTGGYVPSLLLDVLKKLPGPAQGLLGVKGVDVTINDDLSVVAKTELMLPQDRSESVNFKSQLLAETPSRLSETFSGFQVLGRDVSLPGPLAFMRRMIVSYLDDDLLVVRDENGKPEVLVRKPMAVSALDAADAEEEEEEVPEPVDDEFGGEGDDQAPSDV